MALKNRAGLIRIIDAIECMEKSLSCAICLEISSDPVETRCGHLFCRTCIQKVLSHPGESCPVCKFNLTRRSVSSSDHMGLCIQQLSRLIDAVCTDTDIDIGSCLKVHYKKRAFLPSASSSSAQSQQRTQNEIPSLESDNNTKKNPQNHEDSTDLAKHDSKSAPKESSVEYPIYQPKEQTINNLSHKIITKKCQLEANPLPLTAISPSREQNENVLPPENNSDALNKSKSVTETHQVDPKANDETDPSFEENRQCLKDISTLNLNRSLTDQSTKTWSRVTKFGKELRRKSGKNAPRIHKKPKLSVNVRDKSILLNTSHDRSGDPEKNEQNRVDYDTDTNNLMLNRHEDDINISANEIKKTVGGKINPLRLIRDDETIMKNKKQQTLITINSKIRDENVPFEPNVEANEGLSNFGLEISEPQIKRGPQKMLQEKQKLSNIYLPSNSPKTLISVNNTDKQSSEDKGRLSEASSAADSGKSLFSANAGSKQSSEKKEKLSKASSTAESGKSLFSANKEHNQSSEENGKVSDGTLKADSEQLVIQENEISKSYEKKGMHSDASSSDFEKLVDTANKGSERLSEERGKLLECLNTSAGKDEKNTRVVGEKMSSAPDVESRKRLTKRTQYARVAENVVPFKKLGHLFRVQKKNVAFLYLGSIKPQVCEMFSNSESASICQLCSSCQLSDKSTLLQKHLGLPGRLSRAKSFESASFNNQKRLPLPEISTSRIDKNDNSRENHFQIPSAPKERTISPKNYSQSRCLSKDDRSQSASTKVAEKTLLDESESLESSIIGRKRKRSQTSDHDDQCLEEQNGKRLSKNPSESPDREVQCPERQSEERVSKKRSKDADHEDQCTKNQSRKRASDEMTRTENDNYISVDSLINKTLHSQALRKSPQIEYLAVQEKDTTDVNNSPEQENVDVEPVEIDFRMKNTFEEANITLRGNIPKTLPKPTPAQTPKKVNCPEDIDVIAPRACERSKTYTDIIERNSDIHEYEEGSEFNFSRASMMDITGEELLLKKFEEQLFGPGKHENVRNDEKRSENNEECKENPTDSSAMKNLTTKATLVEHDQSLEIEDFVELTPTEQNLNSLNKPPDVIRNKESTAIQPHNSGTTQNRKEKKTAETPLRRTRESEKAEMHTSAQSVTKMRPVYQSTPKSSQVSTDRYRLTVYRQINQNANSPIRALKRKDMPRTLKPNPPVSRRGCILCSGLTLKQSEDVRYFSSLFEMQYTKKFTDDVTHIIVKTNDENNGACKTLKYLQGVAYRKWVLNFNWIVDSVAQKKLLNEELYEVVDSTTLIAGPKKARSGVKGPFDGFVFYCVEPFRNISVPDYEDLLRQMGATVVRSLEDLAAEESIFKIIAVQPECHEEKMIEWHQITKAVPVAQEWIVECISQYRLVSLLPFLLELLPQDILDLGFPEELIQDDDSDVMYDIST